jgi:hypothetical protein
MSEAETDLRAEIARSLPEGTEETAHPSPDELIAYQSGQLEGETAERLQEHVTYCRRCLDDLLDLEAFVSAGQGPPAEAGSFGAASTWRALQPDLGRPVLGPSGLKRRSLSWMPMAAAALLLVSVGLALWGAQQRAQLQNLAEGMAQPQANALIVDLFPASAPRGTEAGEQALELSQGPGFVILVLHLASAVDLEVVEVDLEDTQGGVLWHGQLRISEYGTLRLGVPQSFLSAGRYRLQVYASATGERRLVEAFSLDIARTKSKR